MLNRAVPSNGKAPLDHEVFFEVYFVLLEKVISLCSFPCEVPRCSGGESYYHRPWFLSLATVCDGSSNSMSNVHITGHTVTIFLDNHLFANVDHPSLDVILCTFGQRLQSQSPSPTVPILVVQSVLQFRDTVLVCFIFAFQIFVLLPNVEYFWMHHFQRFL